MSNTAQAPAPAPERMLEAAEVAEHLNLSLTAVYRLARSGALESHRHGQGEVRPRGLRFPESAVVAHLNRSRVSPGSATSVGGAIRIPESELEDVLHEEVA